MEDPELQMEDPELQGYEACGEDATAGNGPYDICNDKDDYCLDGDRAADRCQVDSNDEISAEKENLNSSDSDSAANRCGTSSSEKISLKRRPLVSN